VAVLVGRAPESAGHGAREGVVDDVRATAREAGLDALGAVHGDRLVVVLGGVSDADKAGALLLRHFGEGPVVVGPLVPDLLQAHVSAVEAVAGLRASAGWPTTPALVTSEDLLAERVLDGDLLARRSLVENVYLPLQSAGPEVVETLTAFLDQGGSIEGTARVLFVHPNTVRYRLRRVLDLTGLATNDARHAFTLRIALVVGRLGPHQAGRTPPL
jgi:DNA-binding PucR family transcriptional regulator